LRRRCAGDDGISWRRIPEDPEEMYANHGKPLYDTQKREGKNEAGVSIGATPGDGLKKRSWEVAAEGGEGEDWARGADTLRDVETAIYIPEGFFRRHLLGEDSYGQGGVDEEDEEGKEAQGEKERRSENQASRLALAVERLEAEAACKLVVAPAPQTGMLVRGKGLSEISPCLLEKTSHVPLALAAVARGSEGGGHVQFGQVFRRVELVGDSAARKRGKELLLRTCLSLKRPVSMPPDVWLVALSLSLSLSLSLLLARSLAHSLGLSLSVCLSVCLFLSLLYSLSLARSLLLSLSLSF
jgi:hypothetical protein